MILRVLRKIIDDEGKGIVIVPFWSNQPWFPLYMRLAMTKPLMLRPHSNLLTFGSRRHPLNSSLTLMASVLSAKQQNFTA